MHQSSSTDYIQAFLFLKCNFPVPIHSFSKCTRSFFVHLCPAVSEKQTHTAPTSVPCMKNLLMREHLISSLDKKKLNLRKQFSQLKLLKLHKGSPLKENLFPAVPWHTSTAVCSLYCDFAQPSHSCMSAIGTSLPCSFNTRSKAAPAVENTAMHKCSSGSHTAQG